MLLLILMLNTMKILAEKVLNLNLVIALQYQNTKTVLLMDIPKTGMKKLLSLAKLVNTFLNSLKVLEEILMLKLIFQIISINILKNVKHIDTSIFALKQISLV